MAAIDPAAIEAAIKAIRAGAAARQSWAEVANGAIRDLETLKAGGRVNLMGQLAQRLEQLVRGLGLGLEGQAAIHTINASLGAPKAAQSPQRDGRRPTDRGRFY